MQRNTLDQNEKKEQTTDTCYKKDKSQNDHV